MSLPRLAAILLLIPAFAQAQGQLRTDPAIGNIQSAQRRHLRTDPDVGEGFSYQVHPAAQNIGVTTYANSGGTQTQPANYATNGGRGGYLQSLGTGSEAKRIRDIISKQGLDLAPKKGLLEMVDDGKSLEEIVDAINNQLPLGSLTSAQKAAFIQKLNAEPELTSPRGQQQFGPAPGGVLLQSHTPQPTSAQSPYDWTSGLRNVVGAPPGSVMRSGVPTPLTSQFGNPYLQSLGGSDTDIYNQALSYNRATTVDGKAAGPGLSDIYHQPLIQVKLRVIEVARQDGLAANSILEYVSQRANNPSLTSGSPLNAGNQNLSGMSNFPVAGLFNGMPTSGPGALINLTSRHINWAASFLTTEMNADVITAPEVVTLNGQNVEFVAGEKLPFALGQNVINGSSNNIQQVFYKHVGTMVSVTPRIVNWGFHGEGGGEASIQASEVADWPRLLAWMAAEKLITAKVGSTGAQYTLSDYYNDTPRLPPFELKSQALLRLNKFSRRELVARGLDLTWIEDENCANCRWSAEDCTIDLALVVRLSSPGKVTAAGTPNTLGETTTESNVRAVSNIIQVKSGHGVVMAGLIGERETDAVNKTPILGDLPLIGAAFRSKAVDRVKTEVLIFVEARVLDSNPETARAQSSENYRLGGGYVAGGLLDNPLECGLEQVGFGSYLPPHTKEEAIFWERHGRRVMKIGTHIDDIFK